MEIVGFNKNQVTGSSANGLGDLGSMLGRVIPKTQKMILHAYLLNTQHYKARIIPDTLVK